MEKMEKVPGRKEKADQVPRHTRIEVFMRVLIENNTNGPVFRLWHTRCNGRTLTHVFGMLLK